MRKPRNSFSVSRAAKLSRVGNRAKSLLRPLELKGKSTHQQVSVIANEVLRALPFGGTTSGISESIRFFRSISSKAAVSLKIRKPVGYAHCVERCNAALGLLRKAGVRAWLAREVFFEVSKGKFSVHDYVEFANKNSVHTLAFGISPDGQDYFNIYDSPCEKIPSVASSAMNQIFRGVDGSQIGGVKDYASFKHFLADPLSTKQLEKNRRRIKLMVDSGLIPRGIL